MTQRLKIWSILQSLRISNSLILRLYESIFSCIKYISIEIITSGKRLRPLQISKKTTWQSIQAYANDYVHKSCEVQLYVDRNRTKVNMSGPILSMVFGDIVPSVRNWKQLTQLGDHTGSVYTCSSNSDGTRFASGSDDQTIRIWNVDQTSDQFGTCLKVLTTTSFVDCVAYHPTKPFLASTNYTKIHIWNVDESSKQFGTRTTLEGHTSCVTCISYSPDGKYLASGSSDKTIRIWNVNQSSQSSGHDLYRCVKVLRGHTYCVYSIHFHPNGTRLVSGSSDETVRIWNMDETSEKFGTHSTLTGHNYSVRCVYYSPNGKYIASGSCDKTIRIWNVDETSEKFGTHITLTGHTDWVNSLSYSPNGKYVTSGSNDRTIRIWNVDHSQSFGHDLYQCVKVLHGHMDTVWSMCFHPNGEHLVSGGWDNTIRIWGCS